MTLGVLIEVIVIALLLATCGYCIVLSRRLAALRAGQTDLGKAIAVFDDAARRAEGALRQVDASGLANARSIAKSANEAQLLSNELSVMISAGERIADRLENALADVRAVGARQPASKRKAA